MSPAGLVAMGGESCPIIPSQSYHSQRTPAQAVRRLAVRGMGRSLQRRRHRIIALEAAIRKARHCVHRTNHLAAPKLQIRELPSMWFLYSCVVPHKISHLGTIGHLVHMFDDALLISPTTTAVRTPRPGTHAM